jgi:hypothetical protein
MCRWLAKGACEQAAKRKADRSENSGAEPCGSGTYGCFCHRV